MHTIQNEINNEIVINKSRFITYLFKVNNEQEITDIISNIKNKYKDASHYCYSYIIGNYKRFNDNGEPSGTAGLPILNVLESNKLDNILCIVVRYFGGIKLGTGGLVRAYTKSVTETLSKTKLNNIVIGKKIIISFNYDKVKHIDNILKNIDIKNKIFNDKTIYEFELSNEEYNNLIDNIKNNVLDIKCIDNIKIEKAIK